MHWPIRHFHPSTTLDISGCNLVPLLLSPNLVHICRVPTLPILATTPYFMWFSKKNTISFSQMTESRRSYLRLRETQSFYSRNEEEISGRTQGFLLENGWRDHTKQAEEGLSWDTGEQNFQQFGIASRS